MSRAAILVSFAVCVAAPSARAGDRAKNGNIDIGLLVSAQALGLGSDPLSLTTRSAKTFTMNGAELGRFAAMPIELRARVGIGPFRAGPLLAAGPVFAPNVFDARAGLRTFGVGVLVDFGFAFGVVLPRWKWLQPEVELAAGGRFLGIPLFHPDRGNANGVVRYPILTQPLVEPRAALDVWLSAHATLEIWASVDAAWPGEPAIGLALTYHTLPYSEGAR